MRGAEKSSPQAKHWTVRSLRRVDLAGDGELSAACAVARGLVRLFGWYALGVGASSGRLLGIAVELDATGGFGKSVAEELSSRSVGAGVCAMTG